jgi:hypothetical protein
MSRKPLCAALAVALLAPVAAHAAGWKTITDKPGKCQAQIPADWTPGEFGLGMQAPSGDSTLAIFGSHDSVALDKQVAQSTFTIETTVEDSAARYEITLADRVGKPDKHIYVAVPSAAGSCTLTVDYDSGLSDADAQTIAASLKPH